MPLARVFRTFLVGDALLTTVTVLGGIVRAAAASEGAPSESFIQGIVEIAVLAVWVTALVGLWRFRNWARVLYLVVAGGGLLGTVLIGGEPHSGLEAALNALCWLVTGVIIALAYWSSLAATFHAGERAA